MMFRFAAAAIMSLAPLTAAAQDATLTFINTEGAETGTGEIHSTPNGILIKLEVTGLPPEQWVGFHMHENGVCDAETGFDTAGGHFNPAGVEHGYLTETGPHAGDMPNLWVDADGTVRAEVFNPMVTLSEGEVTATGKSLMIHDHADDYVSQPTGDAGGRAACAVIG